MKTHCKQISMFLILFLGTLILGGCAELYVLQTRQEIREAIKEYQAAESKVKIGDSKEEVLGILQPTQEKLSPEYKRAPEHWVDTKNGKTVDLNYFRSGWIADGKLTDDEFIPYLFLDNTLIAVGWNALRSLVGQVQSSSQKMERNSRADNLRNQIGDESGLLPTSDGETLFKPITPNAYGPGINTDATGRPFTYQPDFGSGGGQMQVTPDAYGPGVGMDQYGRPVRPRSWP